MTDHDHAMNGEIVTPVEYTSAERTEDGKPRIIRIEPDWVDHSWHFLIPDRLLRAYEEKQAAVYEARCDIVQWIADNDAKEIEPTWAR